jgi:hypothetical protein
MRAVGEVGEAIVRSNTAAIEAEKSLTGLAQEAIVLKLDKSAGNCVLVGADLLCVAAGEENLAIVQTAVPQFATQFNPERPRNEVHGAPCRCVQDC